MSFMAAFQWIAVFTGVTRVMGGSALRDSSDGIICTAIEPDGPVIVTPICIDSEYSTVFIDSETDESSPVPHHKVAAHFSNSDITINIYLPPKSDWEGRFFQMVYPTQESDALDVNLAFGSDSGGYTVQITGTGGYRADAAAAKFARHVAAEYYDSHDTHIYGYIYGGSGGSFQTVGAIENTHGIWDGAVPIIQAVPVSFMNNPTIRCMAGIVLRDKKDQIAAAFSPGGSGNPYEDLTGLEAQILKEATLMGIPLQAWEVFDAVTNCTTMDALRNSVQGLDPTYADEFWSKPGYLGTERSELGDLFRSLKIEHRAVIMNVQQDADAGILISLDTGPDDLNQLGLDFTVVARNGSELGALKGTLTSDNVLVVTANQTQPDLVPSLSKGLTIRIDNKWFIAMHAYYRYQVPTRSGFYGFNQFKDVAGNPLYPQRPIDSSAAVAKSASGGGTHTGNITGKMIVVSNLVDYDAFPWHADWYQSQVKKALGSRFDDSYRLWYNENADHNFGPVRKEWLTRVFDFTGIYHQALRDLSAWVEKEVSPPLSTRFTVSNTSQVLIPAFAKERFGIQPSVYLSSNCSECPIGQSVSFTGHIEVPSDAGKIVSVEWDFLGTGDFVDFSFGAVKDAIDIQSEFTYKQPGLYRPVIRATSQREGNTLNPNRRVMNLGRIALNVV